MPSLQKSPVPRSYVINADADRRLARIAMINFGIFVVLLTAITVGMSVVNASTALPLWPKRLLNGLSLLVVLVPFYFGIYKQFQTRLEIGRERAQARAWAEAVAALAPFDTPFQRFLDASGEAHYWLGQAYAGLGDKIRAEKARAFVRRKTGSPWAEKLQPNKGPGISRTASRSNAKVYDAQEGGQEKRPSPPKTKPRRRF